MTVLEWPVELPPVDRDALCAELDSLIEQVINEDIHAADTLDDQFAPIASSAAGDAAGCGVAVRASAMAAAMGSPSRTRSTPTGHHHFSHAGFDMIGKVHAVDGRHAERDRPEVDGAQGVRQGGVHSRRG